MIHAIFIRDRAHILTHLECYDMERLRKILNILEKLSYDIVFLVTNRKLMNYISSSILQNSNLLILYKQHLCSRELRKANPYMYDVVSVLPENRFYLNKIMRMIDVDIISIDINNRDSIPTSDQLSIIRDENKAIEILMSYDKILDYKYLRTLQIFLDKCIKKDAIFFLAFPVKDIYDVKNPNDVYSIIETLCDVDRSFIIDLRRKQLEFISDTFYRRGVEVILSC